MDRLQRFLKIVAQLRQKLRRREPISDAEIDVIISRNRDIPELAAELEPFRPTQPLAPDNAGASPSPISISDSESSGSDLLGAELPKRFGEFDVMQELGRGGMGIVFLAYDAQRKPVAVKTILGSPIQGARILLEKEANALGQISHPNIPKLVRQVTEERGQPYFVMEYVPGATLTRFCSSFRPLEERIKLIREVCRVVEDVRQSGLSHRDLKPSNILVQSGPGGIPVIKLIDWGLAEAPFGWTLWYSPKEQIGNPAGAFDQQRAEVHALGAVLYELLVGTRPRERRFPSEQLDLLHPQQVEQLARSYGELDVTNVEKFKKSLRKQLKRHLDAVTIKAMAEDPRIRYATAGEFSKDLERYLKGEAVIARRPGTGFG